MKFAIAAFITLAVGLTISAQEARPKHDPIKLIELTTLTKREVKEKLIPIWEAHKCTEPWVKWIVDYGTLTEIRRRRTLVAESIGLRCDFPGFRALFVDVEAKEPKTVIWNVWPGEELPIDPD